jgi:futalosine hydrolase
MAPTPHASTTETALDTPVPVAVVTAVPQEAAPLQRVLRAATTLVIGRRPAHAGLLAGTPAIVLAGGMGKTNAAQALTALLENRAVRGVMNVGVAGAYPGSGLELGALALACEEIYGDEGVGTPTGWRSTEEIGIPLLDLPAAARYNRFPLDLVLVERARVLLRTAGFGAAVGAFVTVSCCSGTSTRGAEIAARFGALCESMEGAALAHVAALYGVPFLELRAISNLVEERDLSRWRLREAIETACHAAREVLPVFLRQRP